MLRLWGGRRVGQTPAAPQPPTPFTYSKARFCMRVKGAREAQTTRTQRQQPTRQKRIYTNAIVVGQIMYSLSAMHVRAHISCHVQNIRTVFVLSVGGERLARASILSKLYDSCQSSTNHSVIIKSSSSSTRVLGARRPTKNRETRHLGARRPTQAQSTLRPQALGARRPTKRTEVLQLGSTSATQAQR